jgi:hypothetical protein
MKRPVIFLCLAVALLAWPIAASAENVASGDKVTADKPASLAITVLMPEKGGDKFKPAASEAAIAPNPTSTAFTPRPAASPDTTSKPLGIITDINAAPESTDSSSANGTVSYPLDSGATFFTANPGSSADKSSQAADITAASAAPTATPSPTCTPTPTAPPLYPFNVEETQDNGSKQIIKSYTLADGDDPNGISRDSFIRDGWRFDLADITKSDSAQAEEKAHTETVTVNTASKDMDTILAALKPTLDYKSDDGYCGVLNLDIKSISVETAGAKTSSYKVNATREYPHLSNNDVSLIPKSITDDGRTLQLSDVQWSSQDSENVDYDDLPVDYTATATYSGTAFKSYVTGYTVTAGYSGNISRISPAKTVYKAYFIGTQLSPEPEAHNEAVETSGASTIGGDISAQGGSKEGITITATASPAAGASASHLVEAKVNASGDLDTSSGTSNIPMLQGIIVLLLIAVFLMAAAIVFVVVLWIKFNQYGKTVHANRTNIKGE